MEQRGVKKEHSEHIMKGMVVHGYGISMIYELSFWSVCLYVRFLKHRQLLVAAVMSAPIAPSPASLVSLVHPEP